MAKCNLNNYCSSVKAYKPIKKVLAPVDDIDGELQNEIAISKDQKNTNKGKDSFGNEELKESKDIKDQISNNAFIEPMPNNSKPETIYPNYSSKNEEKKNYNSNLNSNSKIIFHSNDFNSQFTSFDKFMQSTYKKKKENSIEVDPLVKMTNDKETQLYPENDQIFNIIKQSEDPFLMTTEKLVYNKFNNDNTKLANNNIINDILSSIDLSDNKSMNAQNEKTQKNCIETTFITKKISPSRINISYNNKNNLSRFDGYIQDKKMKEKIFSQINELVSTTECTGVPEINKKSKEMFNDKIKRSIYEDKRIKQLNDKKEKELQEKESKLKESLKPWQMSQGSKIFNTNTKITYERVEDRLLKTGIDKKEKINKQSKEQAEKSKVGSQKKKIKCIDLARLTKKNNPCKHLDIQNEKQPTSQLLLKKRSESLKKGNNEKSIANVPYSIFKPRLSVKISDFSSGSSQFINSPQNFQANYFNFQKIMDNFKSSEICYGPSLDDDIENLHLIQKENNLHKN